MIITGEKREREANAENSGFVSARERDVGLKIHSRRKLQNR
jgi:hypothetical protein